MRNETEACSEKELDGKRREKVANSDRGLWKKNRKGLERRRIQHRIGAKVDGVQALLD